MAVASGNATSSAYATNYNLTSKESSDRCYSIRNILEAQHHKWWPYQQQQEHHQERTHKLSATNIQEDDDDSTEELWRTTDDSYNLEAFNEVNGFWPKGHPLPLPHWNSPDENLKGVLHFDNVWEYEDLNAIVETKLQRMLEETNYDTINIFTDFYKAFKRTRRSDLKSFFQFYDIPINRRHHMCVSLAFELIARIIELFPVLEHYLYVVSCEEQVTQSDYIELCEDVGLNSVHANVEKEHVMVCMKISVAGREGVIILDPGYHVGRAVTVMQDQQYPHTGWFTQSKEPNLQRDYCYNFSMCSDKYVEWHEREIRGDAVAHKCSVVFIEKPYVTAIDVTVRRNLVYNFRSLLARDAKGRVLAGIYLPVVSNCNEAHFTLFYDRPNEQRVKVKYMLNVFKQPKNIPEHLLQHLGILAPQLHMTQRQLIEVGKSLYDALTDQDFVNQLLSINEDIGNIGMTADN